MWILGIWAFMQDTPSFTLPPGSRFAVPGFRFQVLHTYATHLYYIPGTLPLKSQLWTCSFIAWKNKHWGSEKLPGYLIFNVPHFQKWLARSSPKCGKYYQDWNMYLKKITAMQLYRYYVSSFDSRVSVFTRNVHVSSVWSSRPMKALCVQDLFKGTNDKMKQCIW